MFYYKVTLIITINFIIDFPHSVQYPIVLHELRLGIETLQQHNICCLAEHGCTCLQPVCAFG